MLQPKHCVAAKTLCCSQHSVLQQQYCVAAKTLCFSKNTVLQQKHCVAATTLCCSIFAHAFDIGTVYASGYLRYGCVRGVGVVMGCGCGGASVGVKEFADSSLRSECVCEGVRGVSVCVKESEVSVCACRSRRSQCRCGQDIAEE